MKGGVGDVPDELWRAGGVPQLVANRQRKRDPGWVQDVEEILRLELDALPPSKVVPAKTK